MERPCVRVPREEGEATRRELAAADLLDREFDIVVDDGTIYLPVSDPERVPAGLVVVDRDVPARETATAPADLLGYEPSLERLGDLVILDEDDPGRASEIARAVLDSDVPARAVLNRASKVKGDLRVREWDVVAVREEGDGAEEDDEAGGDDRPPTETVHREYGFSYRVDVAEVYFSPRLATERHRVAEQVSEEEHAFDMFAGVGPYAIPFAAAGAEVVAVDLNPAAVRFLRENAAANGVADRVTAVEGDVRDVAPEYEGWADRVVMNLPHSADEFLDAAVTVAGEDCTLHYYDIQPDTDPFGPGEAAIREAATEYDVEVVTRHEVRSYAPHELNVCLDVRLTR
jgi:tRNA (guanine37-N1)-methyltransferase